MRLALAAGLVVALSAAACAPTQGSDSPSATGAGLLVVTAGGTALVDGQDDVPPTLDLRVSASATLSAAEVQARLDGRALGLVASGGAVTASVPPMALGSAHTLDLQVSGRDDERLAFHVVPAAGAAASLHENPQDGAVLDLALQFAPLDRAAVEKALPAGGSVSWPDQRHLRAAWPHAPGGALALPAGLPTQRGSHLAGALRLDLSAVEPGALRRAVVPAAAAATSPAPLVVAFSVGTARSRASLQAHAAQISLASPTGLHVRSDGSLSGDPDGPALDIAHAQGIPLWPLLQNDASDSQGIASLLEDGSAVQRLVAAARRTAQQGDYPGLHLDIEGVPEQDRDHLSALVAALADGLHRDGRRLAVAVVPHKPGHLNVYSAAYDLQAISAKADLVTLMAYDEHTSLTDPGAVAGLAWDRQVLAGSLAEMRSPSTALLGLPLYARAWGGDGSAVADSYAASVAKALGQAGARVDYDFGAATPLVRSADGASSTYFDDAQSLAAKLALVAPLHLRGVALWRLGFEDPAFWSMLPATAVRL